MATDLVQVAQATPNLAQIKQKPGNLAYKWVLPLKSNDSGDHYHSFAVGPLELIVTGAEGDENPNPLPINPFILHRGELDQRGGMVGVGGGFVFDKIQAPQLMLAKLSSQSGVMPNGVTSFCTTYVSNDGKETTPCPPVSVNVSDNTVAGQVFLNLPGWNLCEGIKSLRLYASLPNEPEKFYLFDEVPFNTPTYQYNLSAQDLVGKPQPPSLNQTGQFWHKGDTFGVLGASPAPQQSGGNLTAGNTYTANEQNMLNSLWQMARKFGFLT